MGHWKTHAPTVWPGMVDQRVSPCNKKIQIPPRGSVEPRHNNTLAAEPHFKQLRFGMQDRRGTKISAQQQRDAEPIDEDRGWVSVNVYGQLLVAVILKKLLRH